MEEYLSVFRDGENVYYLNNKGKSIVNCEKIRKKTGNVHHYIMRNYLYIAFGCPFTWENEIRFKSMGKTKKDTITCVADAIFKEGDRFVIIEVDNTQTMKKNQLKIEKYRMLKDRGTFGMIAPKFIWITKTDYRRTELMNLSKGLQTQVFTLSDFNA